MNALRRRHLLALPLAGVLAGCASTPPPATVQVFTSQPQVAPGSTYRYERLPSQAARQGELEAAADALLARAGLRRDDASPRLAVQLAVSQETYAAGSGWGGSSVGIGLGSSGRHSGVGIGLGFPIGGFGAQSSQRVDVQMRDVATGQVVFQSQASGGASAASLLEAALRDFPNAAPGMRQVPLASY
ncbi:DUF4136 domain-containing protein [Ramlibacter henchirensis]|uniref:DUF4136 domain-containing protein n=1 Tax=Ramlibacter henchirensis TaxID=204072 RepID=A0A4Z0C3X9_9BURK|nr:DUF4136 domain-containing protein [Ramlibacter henchirensis]TFZ05554.1 DUF4136 domain-containing protein [Ramlibacter henchirensis]